VQGPGGLYDYEERYDAEWITWIENKPAYLEALKKAKKASVKWYNSTRQASEWAYFKQCALRDGDPKIRCIFCDQTVQHPGIHGTSGMKRHRGRTGCKRQQALKAKTGSIMDIISSQGTKVCL